VRNALVTDDSEDGGDDSASGASATPQKEPPPLGPRPLSSEDPVLRKALDLLKSPAAVKKAA
jgi:hypothetical protein